jgi:hypothetical protein
MSDETAAPPAGDAPPEQPAAGGLPRDLVELEAEIRRRLRSNQRFLERFLDEDFVDDEEQAEVEEEGADEEL